MRTFTKLGRDIVRPLPGGSRLRWAALVLLLSIGAGGASCALLEDEESLSPSPTIAVPTTATTTTNPTRPPSTTAPSVPETTVSTVSAPTTTAPSAGPALSYFEQLLSVAAGYTVLTENIRAINDDWDNRSRADISFSDAESALEAAVQRASALADSFALIEPPPDSGLGEPHRIAQGAVEIMTDTPPQMLEGLRSTDTGDARRAAMVGYLTAYDLLGEVTVRVAAIIGEEAEALLAADRVFPAPPISDGPAPETTPTTVTSDAPPNPGNTKNCSDFATHAQAQAWFDTYYPFYGDVAQMDTNGNQVACEALLNPDPG